MARKPMVLIAFISLLVILALPGIFVNLSEANPFPFRIMDEVPPDDKTEPPTILILSSENNTSHAAGDVVLSVKVDVGYSATAVVPHPYLLEIYYETDWQRGFTYIYDFEDPTSGGKTLAKFNTTITLKGIPEGNHILTVYAVEKGRYEKTVPDSNSSRGYIVEYHPFKIAGSSTTHFAVDTSPPSISVLSVKNGTIYASDVQVDFFVNEPVQNVSSVLDDQGNVTVAGNFTLLGLSSGAHNLTVYATDDAGNVGASETVNFTVSFPPAPSPSPITSSAAPSSLPTNKETPASIQDSQVNTLPSEIVYASAGATAASIVGAAVAAVYLRKRRQSNQTTT